jgi:hypothetical protein
MPYQIVNKAGGYFVCKASNMDDCLSARPHKNLVNAQKQMAAVIINESKRKKNKKMKK